jgi:hypothetical protein
LRLGYPCINNSIECNTDSRFKLASIQNLKYLILLEKTLNYNLKHGFLFFVYLINIELNRHFLNFWYVYLTGLFTEVFSTKTF